MDDATTLTPVDLTHLRRCVCLAREALDDGDEPFGSVLVDPEGAVLHEDRNRTADGDQTRHPGSSWPAGRRRTWLPSCARAAPSTPRASTARCAPPPTAWVGLGRIVYAASTEQLTAWQQGVGARCRAGRAAVHHGRRPGPPRRGAGSGPGGREA